MRTVRGSGRISAIALGCAVMLLVGIAGCIPLQSGSPPEWLQAETSVTVEAEKPGVEGPTGAHHGSEVLMMGRSVMEGLFQYWGWDWEGPVVQDGYSLYYYNLSGPPEIGSDAAAQINEAPDGTIVFFKLCFVDFWASEPGEVNDSLSETLGYVDEVLAAAEGRDIIVILGNALPQVRGDTTQALVELHRAYNAGLEERAATRENVYVFDQYSMLAGSDGSLPRGLALSPDDSHLNSTAYVMFDEELFALLDEITGGME